MSETAPQIATTPAAPKPQTGEDILNSKTFFFRGKPYVSFEYDPRFDRLVEFAGKCGHAVEKKDAKLFPKQVTKQEAAQILAATGQERDALVINIFHRQIFAENGPYDAKGSLNQQAISKEFAQFNKKILELGGKTEQEMNELLVSNPALASKIYNEAFAKLTAEDKKAYNELVAAESAYESNSPAVIDGIEHSCKIGKGAQFSERGFECRHYAPELAAMCGAYGKRVQMFFCHTMNSSSKTVLHVALVDMDFGNIYDPTAPLGAGFCKTAYILHDKSSPDNLAAAFYVFNEKGFINCYHNIEKDNPQLKGMIINGATELRHWPQAGKQAGAEAKSPAKAHELFEKYLKAANMPEVFEKDFSTPASALPKAPESQVNARRN